MRTASAAAVALLVGDRFPGPRSVGRGAVDVAASWAWSWHACERRRDWRARARAREVRRIPQTGDVRMSVTKPLHLYP